MNIRAHSVRASLSNSKFLHGLDDGCNEKGGSVKEVGCDVDGKDVGYDDGNAVKVGCDDGNAFTKTAVDSDSVNSAPSLIRLSFR